MKTKKKNNIFETIRSVFSYTLLSVLVLIAGFLLFYVTSSLIAKLNNKNPIISLYTIVSPSMEPNIMVYDVIIDTRVTNEDNLQVGDIITFYSESIESGNFTITHRINQIVEVDGEKRYITKGDNNQNVDAGYITFNNIVGKKVFKINQLGRIQVFIASRFGWLLIILIPATIIILLDIFKLKKIYNIKKNIEVIPEIKKVSRVKETEENKKLRTLTSKASRMNNKYKR